MRIKWFSNSSVLTAPWWSTCRRIFSKLLKLSNSSSWNVDLFIVINERRIWSRSRIFFLIDNWSNYYNLSVYFIKRFWHRFLLFFFFRSYLIVEKAWFDDIQREKLMRNRLEDVTCVLYHFFQSKVINSHPYWNENNFC